MVHDDPGETPEDCLCHLFINFCAQLAQRQLQSGHRVMFEHPKGSSAWKLPKMRDLCARMLEVDLDMCAFGLRVPDSLPIKKATHLLLSHANTRALARRCPQHLHHHHQVVAGSCPGIGSTSRYAGRYPPGFVRAILRTVPALQTPNATKLAHSGSERECLVAERIIELNDRKKAEMQRSLMKLHSNLGHPPNSALIRVLRHGGANQAALDLAKELQCDQCVAQQRPKAANPSQTHRVTEFNSRVGIDVKFLPGWLPNQKIPAVNIVDYASSFQIVVPLAGRETADSIRHAFQERWVAWAGMPTEICLDPARTNVADAMTVPQELAGARICSTAAEAHWQLGKVEVTWWLVR